MVESFLHCTLLLRHSNGVGPEQHALHVTVTIVDEGQGHLRASLLTLSLSVSLRQSRDGAEVVSQEDGPFGDRRRSPAASNNFRWPNGDKASILLRGRCRRLGKWKEAARRCVQDGYDGIHPSMWS